MWTTFEDIVVVNKGKDFANIGNAQVVVCSYDLARKSREILGTKWTTIIADESHYLKNRSAQRVKALAPLLKKCRHVLLLSGTPALNRADELFSPLSILYPTTFTSFNTFAHRFCAYKKTRWGWDSTGSSNTDEMALMIESTMVRRLKKDVLSQLPKKIRRQISIPLSKKESKELGLMKVELAKINDKLFSNPHMGERESRTLSFERQSMISEMFRQTARAKCPAVQDFAKGVIADTEHKLIFFAYHKLVLDAIQEIVKEPFIRIDGSTPMDARQPMIDEFNQTETRIALLSIGACNSGINLTSCSHIIFAELNWTPSL